LLRNFAVMSDSICRALGAAAGDGDGVDVGVGVGDAAGVDAAAGSSVGAGVDKGIATCAITPATAGDGGAAGVGAASAGAASAAVAGLGLGVAAAPEAIAVEALGAPAALERAAILSCITVFSVVFCEALAAALEWLAGCPTGPNAHTTTAHNTANAANPLANTACCNMLFLPLSLDLVSAVRLVRYSLSLALSPGSSANAIT
jgi:hypothetical protein